MAERWQASLTLEDFNGVAERATKDEEGVQIANMTRLSVLIALKGGHPLGALTDASFL